MHVIRVTVGEHPCQGDALGPASNIAHRVIVVAQVILPSSCARCSGGDEAIQGIVAEGDHLTTVDGIGHKHDIAHTIISVGQTENTRSVYSTQAVVARWRAVVIIIYIQGII